jgi:Raf kinase inhibitor-like YbhB/YbcL family protein
MQLASTAFTDSGKIPTRYTCDGEKTNPPLSWVDVPVNAKSLVLIVDDPDVPRNLRPDGMFVHWLVWNMLPTTTAIAEHSEPMGITGLATNGQLGYAAPCPPNGSHRYYFRLYALDCELTVPSTSTKGELLRAMQGHILDQAELMGRYECKI